VKKRVSLLRCMDAPTPMTPALSAHSLRLRLLFVTKPYISLREFGGVEFRVKSSFPRTTSWERRRAGELPFKNSFLFLLIETYLLRMSGSM
jgi:hypothetical protein